MWCVVWYLRLFVGSCVFVFFFQAEDGIRDLVRSRGLGDVYKRQAYALEQAEENEGHQSLPETLAALPDWNPARAFALMVFVMLYAPCLVTVAVIRRESGSWKWAAFATLYSTGLAFTLAVLIYQVGSFLAGL